MLAEELRSFEAALSDRYHLRREVGRGAWGVVYLAEAVATRSSVAVKILRPEFGFASAHGRFLREIDIVRHLQHPNIVPVLDSGECGGTLYYVMPFIDGSTLEQRIAADGQLPIAEAVRIASDVAAALDHAHRAGVIHRDIKPANILLDNGRTLVADFGIARAIRQSGPAQWVSSANVQMGTPEYMSAEQATGDSLDARSDIYSLGCVVYEMLAGAPPFTASTTAGLLARHALDPVPPLRSQRPSVSPAVERVVLTALAKTPADRFPTAGAFAAALLEASKEIESASTTGASLHPPSVPRSPWRARAPWVAAAAIVLAAAAWPAIRAAHPTPPSPGATWHDIVLVQEGSPETAVGSNASVLAGIRDASGTWEDVRVGAESSGDRDLVANAAAATTDDLGTRSVLAYHTERAGDSLTVIIRRISRDAGRVVFDRTLREATTATGAREAAARLTRRLFAAPELSDADVASAPSRTLVAWHEYAVARRDIETWNLRAAQRHLDAALAVRGEPFAPAMLWSIQLEAIRNPFADSAWLARARELERVLPGMHGRDSVLAALLTRIARGDTPAAARLTGELLRHDSTDVIAWIDRGVASGRDPIVIRDRTSPTGWRFRSAYSDSYNAFLRAARLDARAVQWLPISQISTRIYYRAATVRSGHAAPPDTGSFYALPSVDHDSAVLLPVPSQAFMAGAVPASVARAVDIARRRLANDLADWIRRDSTSSDAFRILSEILEINGDVSGPTPATSAVLALDRAMSLETVESKRAELRATRLRLLLKQEHFADVRAEARRFLDDPRSSDVPAEVRASIAGLIGDRPLAARLLFAASRGVGSRSTGATDPAQVAAASTRFHADATIGSCSIGIASSLDSLMSAIDRTFAPNDRQAATRRLVAGDAAFAAPCIGAASAAPFVDTTTSLGRMIAALARQRAGDVAHELADARRSRSGARPTDVTPDHALVEAWLALQIGDTATAKAALDAQVLDLRALPPTLFNEVSAAGAIGRGMLLRARLAGRDSIARKKWLTAAENLLGPTDSTSRRIP